MLASGAVTPPAEVQTSTTRQLDDSIEKQPLLKIPLPSRFGAGAVQLNLGDLRDQAAAAEVCRQETAASYEEIAQNVAGGNPADLAGVSDVVNRMRECIRGDVAIGSLLMDFNSTDRDFILTHGLNVGFLVTATGKWMGLEDKLIQQVAMAALLQDIGMLRVPETIRFANRPLTDDDRAIVEHHPIHSLDMLENSSFFGQTGLVVAYQVHEQCNRSGYPRKRQRATIHPMARLTAVADVYAAVTCTRPYRQSRIPYQGVTTLLEEAKAGRLDPDYVRIFLDCFGLFPVGSYVGLSDGRTAQVIHANGPKHTRPVIVPIEFDGRESDEQIDLVAQSDLSIVRAISKGEATGGEDDDPVTRDEAA